LVLNEKSSTSSVQGNVPAPVSATMDHGTMSRKVSYRCPWCLRHTTYSLLGKMEWTDHKHTVWSDRIRIKIKPVSYHLLIYALDRSWYDDPIFPQEICTMQWVQDAVARTGQQGPILCALISNHTQYQNSEQLREWMKQYILTLIRDKSFS